MTGPREERGESLIEVLITVVILGLAVVAILSALGTLVRGTDIHRQQSNATVVAENAAEAIKGNGTAFVTCATPADYAAAVAGTTRPTGWAAPTVLTVQYWNGSGFGSTCYDSTAAPLLAPLQLVSVKAASPNGRGTSLLSFVKRRAS